MDSHKDAISMLLSAICVAKEAGREILSVYRTDFSVEHKSNSSPVTIADKLAHRIISEGLSAREFGNFPILSEEGKNIPFEDRKDWEHFWLVDPLDGTKEFISGNGEFTVNIALVNKDRPVLGVVYVPVNDLFYVGAEGLGSYKLSSSEILEAEQADVKDSGRELFDIVLRDAVKLPSVTEKNKRIIVLGSRSHLSKETEDYIRKLRKRYGEVDFISSGSSLKFCLVAEGMADLYPRFAPTMEWDTAAGQVVVEQAGGRVVDCETSNPLRYNKKNLLNHHFTAYKKDIQL